MSSYTRGENGNCVHLYLIGYGPFLGSKKNFLLEPPNLLQHALDSTLFYCSTRQMKMKMKMFEIPESLILHSILEASLHPVLEKWCQVAISSAEDLAGFFACKSPYVYSWL